MLNITKVHLKKGLFSVCRGVTRIDKVRFGGVFDQ